MNFNKSDRKSNFSPKIERKNCLYSLLEGAKLLSLVYIHAVLRVKPYLCPPYEGPPYKIKRRGHLAEPRS